jgi:hypothetical protein
MRALMGSGKQHGGDMVLTKLHTICTKTNTNPKLQKIDVSVDVIYKYLNSLDLEFKINETNTSEIFESYLIKKL